MRYHDITTNDMKNGDGLRTVLWVAGCSHHCKGCHNPITWDADGGIEFDEKAEEELFSKLSQEHISGITFSGGDPLFVPNRQEILRLIKKVRKEFPNKTIWLYTGFKYETLLYLIADDPVVSILENIDVLVDGVFIEELKDVNYHWAGSTNQRVINIKESLKEGRIIIHG